MIARFFPTLLLVVALAAVSLPAGAATLIRDAEIEATLTRIASPVIRAAGLSPQRIRIVLIKDPEPNAFVTGSDAIFINSGLLQRLPRLEMIQAVLAHEVAHIAAGHRITRPLAARNSSAAAVLGVVLGAVAASAGAGDAAVPLALGGRQISERRFLAHSRSEESAADQASIRYLAVAGIDPKAALDVLDLFRGQELLAGQRVDPYARTHPLTSRRLALMEERARGTPVSKAKQDPSLPYWHARMVAKLNGFLRTTRGTKASKDKSEIGVYRQAIALHRMSDRRAISYLDSLIKARPKDPYYRELKGQFLFERGEIGPAIDAYRQAKARAPKNILIQTGLARALLGAETKAGAREALKYLTAARLNDLPNPGVLRDLARAHAALGQTGQAVLATAERFALAGRMEDTALQAKRAMGLLPKGTPAWRQAQELYSFAAPAR